MNVGSQTQTEFGQVMRALGYDVEPIIADNVVHRFRVDGDRGSQRSGSGYYQLDRHGGMFGNFRTGERHLWRNRDAKQTLAERLAMRAELDSARERYEAERARLQQCAQQRARAMWDAAAPAEAGHPYLTAKCVQPHALRQRGALLLVPMRDATGELWAVQTINAVGEKRFLRGSRKHALYCGFGGPVASDLYIAEGYATAASVHEATNAPVAVAFDAGNLEPVARVLRSKFPTAAIVICADNDAATAARTGRNPGLENAERAARAIGARVAVPPAGFNDFNDVARGAA